MCKLGIREQIACEQAPVAGSPTVACSQARNKWGGGGGEEEGEGGGGKLNIISR